MNFESLSLGGDFLSLMGYEFNSNDVEIPPPSSAHTKTFDMSFYSQLFRLECPSSFPSDAPGPSGSQGESFPGHHYPPTDWFPEYEPATTWSNAMTSATPSGVLHEYYRLPSSTKNECEPAAGNNITISATAPARLHDNYHLPQAGIQDETSSEYEPATGSNVTTPGATTPVVLHDYYRLPGTEDGILDRLLAVSAHSKLGRKTFKCTSSGCTFRPFTGKCQAYAHVCKHLNIKKLYGCVACHTKFSTRGAAKRHCESQQTSFSCSICQTVIKRKDYWRKHERICVNKN